jgi:hypothetical protein
LLIDLANLLPDQESEVTIKEVTDTQIIVRCLNRNRDLLNVKEIVSKVSDRQLLTFLAFAGPHGRLLGLHLGASHAVGASRLQEDAGRKVDPVGHPE